MESEKLFLNSDLPAYKVAPLAVMAILNHHQRREDENPAENVLSLDYAVGVLFGRKEDNVVYIADACAVACRQNNDGQLMLLLPQIQNAVDLYFQSHPNERLVGTFMSKLQMGQDNVLFHTMFLDSTEKNMRISVNSKRKLRDSEMVQMLVDAEMSKYKLEIKGYAAKQFFDPLELHSYEEAKRKRKQKQKKSAKSGSQTPASEELVVAESTKSSAVDEEEKVEAPDGWYWKFSEVDIYYTAEEAEKIGMYMIINCPPEGDDLDSPAQLMSDFEDLESSLAELLEKIQKLLVYVQDVQNGTQEPDESIGWMIAEALAAVPKLSPEKFEEMLSTRLQDLLMLVYLSKLSRAQLTISDKINLILHKTVQQ